MPIINLDVMLARRKMKLNEFADAVGAPESLGAQVWESQSHPLLNIRSAAGAAGEIEKIF